MRSIAPCFDVLSDLCEYLLELLELFRSIWFSFYLYAFYSCFESPLNTYSLFILVMYILLQRIINPLDFVKYIKGKNWPLKKRINCSKITIAWQDKVLSRAHVRSLEQRARNAQDHNEQTLPHLFAVIKSFAINKDLT